MLLKAAPGKKHSSSAKMAFVLQKRSVIMKLDNGFQIREPLSVVRMVGVVLLQAGTILSEDIGRQYCGFSFSMGELQIKLLGLSPLQE